MLSPSWPAIGSRRGSGSAQEGRHEGKRHGRAMRSGPWARDEVRTMGGDESSPVEDGSVTSDFLPMSSAVWEGLEAMSDSTQAPTTVSNIGVAMFSVADQDAALAFYTQKLGYEVRSDMR